MFIRVVATLVLVASVALLVIGSYGLINAGRMASMLAIMSRDSQPAFNPAHWAHRWRIASAAYSLAGLLGVVSGVVMYWRRAWPIALWAGVVTTLFALQTFVYISRSAAYAFEVVEPAELTVLFLIAASSWAYFGRVRATSKAAQVAS
jgi:hypothetical protein